MEKQKSTYEDWLDTITKYNTEYRKWTERSAKIVKIYRDQPFPYDNDNTNQSFNILWSNVQTLTPAIFSKLPKPDVSRRFRDNDPVARVAALILERALEFEIDHYNDYGAAMANCVSDRLLGGRGTAWVRYEPHIKQAQISAQTSAQMGTEEGLQVTEDVDPELSEEIEYECTPVDYVHWRDFGHSPARTWEEVTRVWRNVFMTRHMLVERFGEELGNKIPLDTRPEEEQKKSISVSEDRYQAMIVEGWDKETKTAVWISKSMGKILDEKDDPLGLEEFFPCGRPLYATITSDTLEPVPDYTLYQDQAKTLNLISGRIRGLIKALQVKGVYNAEYTAIARLFTEGGNTSLIPIKDWSAFAEKQGLKGAVDILDITPIANALINAYQAQREVKDTIYEITGISDIVRGQAHASESATATRTKGQYATLRLDSMKQSVVDFATNLLQIKAQIMCQHYEPETLLKISAADQLSDQDKQLIPQAIALLKNEPLKTFRVEISSDSMVNADELQEKQDRMEFLTATSAFIEKVTPVIQATPDMAPLAIEMLKFGVTAFKVGKSMEGQFDEFADQMKKKMQMAAQQPPQPSPEQMKMQQDAQIQQAQMAAEQQRNQMEAQREQQKVQYESQLEQIKIQNGIQLEQLKIQSDMQMKSMELDFERWKVLQEDATKIQVAEIQAHASAVRSQQSGDQNATVSS